jgi:PAS domain S-box-containing protein
VSVDSLRARIVSSRQRLSQLQRRAASSSRSPNVVSDAIAQLELSLNALDAAQQQLVEQRQDLTRVRQQLAEERDRYWHLFDAAPDACVITASDGRILEANRAAAELLNSSQKFLIGRNLSVFSSSERAHLMAGASRLAESGGSADWVFDLRPRERAAVRVTARVVATGDGQDGDLRWVLRREPRSSASDC